MGFPLNQVGKRWVSIGLACAALMLSWISFFRSRTSSTVSSNQIKSTQAEITTMATAPKVVEIETLAHGIHKYRAFGPDGSPLSQLDVFRLWADEVNGGTFREEMRQTLVSQPLDAYFWECTPATVKTAPSTPFEFVIVPAPGLSKVKPTPDTFASYFSDSCSFSSFLNIGRNAYLVSPAPCGHADFAHLARFMKNASPEHGRELFQHVGRTVLTHLGPKPMWLSTSGAGVYWLHVRLDSTPKYYSFHPYRHPPPA